MDVKLNRQKYYYPLEEFQDKQIRRSAEKFYRRFTSQQMSNCWMTKRGCAAYYPDDTYLYFKRYADDTVIIENSVSRRRYDY